MQDSGHVLFDTYGCGATRRTTLDAAIKSGTRSFRDASEEMWGSLNVPFADGFAILRQKLEVDPGFEAFHKWCVEEEIPFNVISAGLKPILRGVLEGVLGEEARRIDIVANDAVIEDEGQWRPVWRHDTELGHDKALSISEARKNAQTEMEVDEIPLIVFIGDGVSDLPAASQADVLFARRGLLLEEHCVQNKIPYIGFDSFSDIQREIATIKREDEAKTAGKGMPANHNPRANLWRQLSSQRNLPLKVGTAAGTTKEKSVLRADAVGGSAVPAMVPNVSLAASSAATALPGSAVKTTPAKAAKTAGGKGKAEPTLPREFGFTWCCLMRKPLHPDRLFRL